MGHCRTEFLESDPPPAILERQWIQIERGLIPPNLDYHHHFLSLAEILSPPQPTDTGRMNPAVPRSLGLVQTIPVMKFEVKIIDNN